MRWGVAHDGTVRGLAVHLRQGHDGHSAAGDDVSQHLARADAGQLIGVAHQHEAAAVGQGAQQLVHEHDVDHAGLVDQHAVGVERVAPGLGEGVGAAVELEQAVDGLGFDSGGLGKPFLQLGRWARPAATSSWLRRAASTSTRTMVVLAGAGDRL